MNVKATPITIDPVATAAITGAIVIVPCAFASNDTPERRVPFSIPEDERYFWSSEWQDAERAASRDIAEGRIHRFADPKDAVRWLLTDD